MPHRSFFIKWGRCAYVLANLISSYIPQRPLNRSSGALATDMSIYSFGMVVIRGLFGLVFALDNVYTLIHGSLKLVVIYSRFYLLTSSF